MTQVKRPVLRYHGGKWMLAKWIISHFPKHRTYCEPFGGAASVLMQKPRCYAEVYNDLDGELVNLFTVLRERGVELKEILYLTPFSRSEFVLSYERSSDPVEQARRTVVRSFMGFGSNSHNKATGFRNDSNRSGTTPAHDWKNYPEALPWMVERLRGVCIENRNAIDIARKFDRSDTLHYWDPPYLPETRDPGSDYRHEMTEQQHKEAAAVAHELNGVVVVSGYPSDLYEELYRDWHRVQRTALADGARERTEVLWINRQPSARLF